LIVLFASVCRGSSYVRILLSHSYTTTRVNVHVQSAKHQHRQTDRSPSALTTAYRCCCSRWSRSSQGQNERRGRQLDRADLPRQVTCLPLRPSGHGSGSSPPLTFHPLPCETICYHSWVMTRLLA